jgi:hypothetical protein
MCAHPTSSTTSVASRCSSCDAWAPATRKQYQQWPWMEQAICLFSLLDSTANQERQSHGLCTMIACHFSVVKTATRDHHLRRPIAHHMPRLSTVTILQKVIIMTLTQALGGHHLLTLDTPDHNRGTLSPSAQVQDDDHPPYPPELSSMAAAQYLLDL